jgi:hypothetical protein
MTRRNSFYILVFISTILTGCFGFDTNTSDNIIGNYYVMAIDDSEESLNYNTNKGGGGFSTVLVDGSVYEVLWNDNFILTKQHPLDSVAELAYNHIRYKLWSETVKTMNLADNSKLYLDTLLNKTVDSIAKADFQKRIEEGDLTFIKNVKQSDITFFYLIDIKNNPEEPTVFFNNDSLNLYLEKLKVGKLTNKRNY